MRDLVRQIVEVCLNVKSGENVWIQSWNHTIDLASEIAFVCRQRGAHPFVTLLTESYWMRSLVETPKRLLEILPSHQAAALERTNAFIFMLGPRGPIDWNKIPPEKRGFANVWYSDSNRYLDKWRRIAQRRSVRMLGVEYCLATEDWAQAWGLKRKPWEEVMLAGCLIDQREITEKAVKLAGIVGEGAEVSVQNPFGTNLKFNLAARKPIIGDSVVDKEDAALGHVKYVPSGFVEVSADENSAEGTVVYDTPILVKGARNIEGLTLKFRHGRVVKYSAKTGVDSFENYMKSTQGDVDRFGFFGVGLNPGLKFGFTQDDKVSGGVTIGIGGNEDKGGENRTEGNRHWWAALTHGTLKIDRQTVLKDGKEVFWGPGEKTRA